MEENKFEKEVRQKMDELKIQPPDSLWNKIESKIEKKNSSKKGWLIFFLLFGFLFAGGYLLWNSKNNSLQHNTIAGKNNTAKETQSSSSNNSITANNRTLLNKIDKNANGLADDSLIKHNFKITDHSQQGNNIHKTLLHYKFSSSQKIHSTNTGSEQLTEPFSEQKNLKDFAANANEQGDINIPDETNSENIQNRIDPLKTPEKDTASKTKNSVEKKAFDTARKKQTAIVKKSKNRQWKFGMVFSGGVSSVKNNIYNSDKVSSASLSRQINGPVWSNYAPSPLKKDFNFFAGAFAERNILPGIKVVLGVNYKSFNNSNITGSKNDSTGTYNYISVADNNKYKNHFNFIEIPVSVKLQLTKKLPLSWQGGIVISQLINTNALQFNLANGSYYADNSVFNKTYFGLNTSLSVAFFTKQKVSLLLGPYIYYSSSAIAIEGIYSKSRFAYTGIKTEIIIGK